MNPIDPRMRTGTIGEILVQLLLLQYGVQAPHPNDLIAISCHVSREHE